MENQELIKRIEEIKEQIKRQQALQESDSSSDHQPVSSQRYHEEEKVSYHNPNPRPRRTDEELSNTTVK
jgi:hypothetical protein